MENHVILEPHECIVILDKNNNLNFYRGIDKHDVFIPQDCKILVQNWAIDLEKSGTQSHKILKFDTRRIYMDFEFTVVTRDYEKMLFHINVSWQIVDLGLMILNTSDPQKYICDVIRNGAIHESGKIKLLQLMNSIDKIIEKINLDNKSYYENIGIIIHKTSIITMEYIKNIPEPFGYNIKG